LHDLSPLSGGSIYCLRFLMLSTLAPVRSVHPQPVFLNASSSGINTPFSAPQYLQNLGSSSSCLVDTDIPLILDLHQLRRSRPFNVDRFQTFQLGRLRASARTRPAHQGHPVARLAQATLMSSPAHPDITLQPPLASEPPARPAN
ncbi:hypothetical protein PTTG_30660, partial [Puccinia triticina 1-1 BBBD Race 1]